MLRYDIPEELSTFTRAPARKGDVNQISVKTATPLDRATEALRTHKTYRSLEAVATLRNWPGLFCKHVREKSITHATRIATVTP